jgi:hypothetical protein
LSFGIRVNPKFQRQGDARDQQIEAHPDDTFYVIQDGTLLVNGGDMDNVTLGLGDYLGERA